MKFLEEDSVRIISSLFKNGIIFIVSYVAVLLATMFMQTSIIGDYISVFIIIVASILKLISIVFILKAICSIIYKILMAIDKNNIK